MESPPSRWKRVRCNSTAFRAGTGWGHVALNPAPSLLQLPYDTWSGTSGVLRHTHMLLSDREAWCQNLIVSLDEARGEGSVPCLPGGTLQARPFLARTHSPGLKRITTSKKGQQRVFFRDCKVRGSPWHM